MHSELSVFSNNPYIQPEQQQSQQQIQQQQQQLLGLPQQPQQTGPYSEPNPYDLCPPGPLTPSQLSMIQQPIQQQYQQQQQISLQQQLIQQHSPMNNYHHHHLNHPHIGHISPNTVPMHLGMQPMSVGGGYPQQC